VVYLQETHYFMALIGRKVEIAMLEQVYASDRPEMVAVLGRRRVGKTYLIRSYFDEKIDFELVGLKEGNRTKQLNNFAFSLRIAIRTANRSVELPPEPSDWLEAFQQLVTFLDELPDNGKKKVVFFDELPWMAQGRTDFLTGFSFFWNSYASKKQIVVIACGSATAWMVNKLLNDKGGLYNRVTRRLHLAPFTLAETEAFLHTRHIALDRYQIALLYMAFGGIPHYLDQLQIGKSAVQQIDDICFKPQGSLRHEFGHLFGSLFSNPLRYQQVVNVLGQTWKGMDRPEIVQKLGVKDGGWLSIVLEDLSLSGFINAYIPFDKKKKDTLYRLTDSFSLFHLQFISQLSPSESGKWDLISQTQAWKSWSGYAFENLCLQHIDAIKRSLGIDRIASRQTSFLQKGNAEFPGFQIDMLIDRNDQTINICEMKFVKDYFSLSKDEADKIRKRKSLFRQTTDTRKQLFITLVTPFGILPNSHTTGLIDQVVTLDDLFV
jgi:uncharacterized protein